MDTEHSTLTLYGVQPDPVVARLVSEMAEILDRDDIDFDAWERESYLDAMAEAGL